MKKILLLLAFMTFSFPTLAASSCTKTAIVDGMVCDFCAQGLVKAFKKNEAVTDVKIDLTTKEVKIETKPDQEISDAEIAKAIDYSGYKLVKIHRACSKG